MTTLTEADVRRISRAEATQTILESLGVGLGAAPRDLQPHEVLQRISSRSAALSAEVDEIRADLEGVRPALREWDELSDRMDQRSVHRVQAADVSTSVVISRSLADTQRDLQVALEAVRESIHLTGDLAMSGVHEGSPLRSGPEGGASDVPAVTVAETTDTDLRGVGESAGPGSPAARPALAEDGLR